MKTTSDQLSALCTLIESLRRAGGYRESITAQPGKKYARLAATRDGDDRPSSAHAFVNLETGDILKCAGWNAPAKGVRGNLHNEDGGASAFYPAGHPYAGAVRYAN